jgi:hypothetical protein
MATKATIKAQRRMMERKRSSGEAVFLKRTPSHFEKENAGRGGNFFVAIVCLQNIKFGIDNWQAFYGILPNTGEQMFYYCLCLSHQILFLVPARVAERGFDVFLCVTDCLSIIEQMFSKSSGKLQIMLTKGFPVVRRLELS